MGGKGSQTAPPQVMPQQSGVDPGMMMAMFQMMSQMNQPQMPMQVPTPEVEETTPIDWAAQTEELRKKAALDQAAQERKGRVQTIHSSLTDEDEETEMKSSLLGSDE